MYEVLSGEREVGGKTINTFKREIYSANIMMMSVVVGDAKARMAALESPADIYVVNRENIKWLVEYFEKKHQPWPFDCCIIDELSSFKNYRSQRFRYLKKVRPFMKRVVGLTGTPASNGLLDLWGEVAIIDQGKRLGKFIGRYREAYFKPGDMNPYTGIVYNYVPLPGAEEAIYDKISDISVSMKSKDYLPDMPECVTVNHSVEMSPAERKLYDEFEAQMVLSLDGQSIDAANAAVLSGRLLEMANGAVYNESHEGGSTKDVYVIRGGQKLSYEEVAIEENSPDNLQN